MQRYLWSAHITDRACPPWPCPVCGRGTIALVPGSLIHKERVTSEGEHHLPDWEPEWMELVFTAWGECTYPVCGERFAISGTGGVDQYWDEDSGALVENEYYPKCCSPTPNMIAIPEECPLEVRQGLVGAFSLYWQNRPACAGRIRVALELLMNHLEVPTHSIDKSGKKRRRSLHQRIAAFAETEPIIGEQLAALKWLGNAGSHDRRIGREALLDAFELLEHVLSELIDKRSERAATLARRLTERYGGE